MTVKTLDPHSVKQRAILIEDERRKLGELAFTELSSPEVIRRLEKLEQMINEYMISVYINKNGANPRKKY